MRKLRRNDLEVRMEMTPLIDVIFLLLTFFIFSFVVMVRADKLPMKIAGLNSGIQLEAGEQLIWVTIDKTGRYLLKGEAIDEVALKTKLTEIAKDSSTTPIRIELEANGQVDRAPMMMRLHQLMREAGIKEYALVGDPKGEVDKALRVN